MYKRHIPVSFLLILSIIYTPISAQDLARVQPETVGMSSKRLERLTQHFQNYIDNDKLPGAVILIARKGKIAYLKAFGQRDREANAPMQENTIVRLASQSKAIISVGVMMLQERGKLLIAEPVGKYIPEFNETTVAQPKEGGGYDIVPAKRKITIRDLLTHTSGVSYGNGPANDLWKEANITGWYFAHRDEPIGDTVARMAKLPFNSQPGERWVYGYSTDILGALIERVSGQPLDKFLQENIFDPLNMKDTHFFLPPKKKDRFAVVYSATDSSGLKRAPEKNGASGQGDYIEGPRKNFSGGAGLLSTAQDYATFLQMLLNGGTFNNKQLLSRKTIELMTTNHIDTLAFRPGQRFGLGFFIVEDVGARGIPGSVGEYGWGSAYHNIYWVDPKEQLVVSYCTQLRPTRRLDDHAKLRALIYQAITD